MISGKKRVVLEELEALDEVTNTGPLLRDGYWMPYHVRYFSGRLHTSNITLDSTKVMLLDLTRQELCDRKIESQTYAYRINDAGRDALEEARAADPAPPEPPIELVDPNPHHSGRRWKIRGVVVAENRDEQGFYVIVEEPGDAINDVLGESQ